jgi:hypothetical protein
MSTRIRPICKSTHTYNPTQFFRCRLGLPCEAWHTGPRTVAAVHLSARTLIVHSHSAYPCHILHPVVSLYEAHPPKTISPGQAENACAPPSAAALCRQA